MQCKAAIASGVYIILRAIPPSEECAENIYCQFLRHFLLQPVFARKERAGRMLRYGAVKYIVNILMGGLVVAFGTVLLILSLRTRFPMTSDHYETSAADTADLFHKWLAVHSPVRYCMTETALGFMRGMIWAGVSLFASLYLTDRLVITMFPFFGSFVIVRISQMLSIDDKWRLDQILIGRTVVKDSGHTVMIAAIASGVLVFLMGCTFTRKMARGLKDGMLYESK